MTTPAAAKQAAATRTARRVFAGKELQELRHLVFQAGWTVDRYTRDPEYPVEYYEYFFDTPEGQRIHLGTCDANVNVDVMIGHDQRKVTRQYGPWNQAVREHMAKMRTRAAEKTKAAAAEPARKAAAAKAAAKREQRGNVAAWNQAARKR